MSVLLLTLIKCNLLIFQYSLIVNLQASHLLTIYACQLLHRFGKPLYGQFYLLHLHVSNWLAINWIVVTGIVLA